jgi:hypothetical protein
MNRSDKARWSRCATFADVGEATCEWITGALSMSPVYHGGPHGETVRHTSLLCRLNRSGMITTGMNDNNEGVPNAMVDLYIRRSRVPRLYVAARQHGVEVQEMPAKLKREITGYFGERVQGSAVEEMERSRYVLVYDPEWGRFSRQTPLWRALRQYAKG